MPFVYYIHSPVNKQGYIGQAKDDSGRRLVEHIIAASRGDRSDGAAALLLDVGIANYQTTVYPSTANYGLPDKL